MKCLRLTSSQSPRLAACQANSSKANRRRSPEILILGEPCNVHSSIRNRSGFLFSDEWEFKVEVEEINSDRPLLNEY